MDSATILADLKETFGNKKLLDADEVADLIARSYQAQANLRNRGSFPIPVKKVGGRVYMSIYDIATFLAGECPDHTAKTDSKPPSSPKPLIAPTVRRRGIAKALAMFQTQREFYIDLAIALEKIILNAEIATNGRKKE